MSFQYECFSNIFQNAIHSAEFNFFLNDVHALNSNVFSSYKEGIVVENGFISSVFSLFKMENDKSKFSAVEEGIFQHDEDRVAFEIQMLDAGGIYADAFI